MFPEDTVSTEEENDRWLKMQIDKFYNDFISDATIPKSERVQCKTCKQWVPKVNGVHTCHDPNWKEGDPVPQELVSFVPEEDKEEDRMPKSLKEMVTKDWDSATTSTPLKDIYDILNRVKCAPIYVWPFEDAPKELQELSTYGGDENWVALIPPKYKESDPAWMWEGSSFGRYGVEEHELENGWTVKIGCHA